MKLMTKLREALSSLREHAAIGTAAMIAGRNVLTDIETAIMRGTDHRDMPADEKYVHEILFLVSNTPGSINFLARRITGRLERARDPVVVLKTLVLVHRLVRGGDRFFEQDFRNLWCSGELRMDVRRPTAVSDHSVQFMLGYSRFLKDRMEWIINPAGPLEPIRPLGVEENELFLHRLSRCQAILDRIIECLPVSIPGSSRVVRLAMSIMLRESFKVYASFCEGVEIVVSSFLELKKPARVLALDVLKKACIQTPSVHQFYEKCKRIFGCKTFDYPLIKIITVAEVSAMEQSFGYEKPIQEVTVSGAKVESKDAWPAIFSCNFETKISTIWVEFDEEGSQSSGLSTGWLDDDSTSELLTEGKSSASQQRKQLS